MLRQLVTIEESTILGMVQDVRYLNEFTFLQQLKGKLEKIGDCSSCRRRSREKLQERKAALADARMGFVGMPGSQRNKLKHLLQTKKVRIIYFSGKKKIQLTF